MRISRSDPQETLALLKEAGYWSITTLHERLIKTGPRLVRHGRYAIFQIAVVALPRQVTTGEFLKYRKGLRIARG